MAKKKKSAVKKTVKTEKKTAFEFAIEKYLSQPYQIALALLIFIILFLVFLNPLFFGGMTFHSADILASESMQNYLAKERDGFSLWNPHIFCGMPAYAIGVEFTWFNIIYVVFTEIRTFFAAFFEVDYAMWAFYLIVLGFTSFLFMRDRTGHFLVSLFTGAATSFSTGLIVFLFIGHVTKLTALCMLPLVFLLIFRFQKKLKLLDFLFMIVAIQLLVQSFHVQIIFYSFFALAIYYIYYFSRSFAKKDKALRTRLLKSGGALALATVIALLIQIDNITQIYEYTDYSTRGTESILDKVNQPGASDEKSDTEYYEYHTSWSFSPGEIMTFIVPYYYGFGNVTYKGALSQNQEVDVNTYFGQMPFVDVAMYMGVIVFFLGLFAMITRWDEPLVRYFTILIAVSLLISFGKNFPILFDFLFYNLPYFDKFRVPSMILVIVQISFPILAGLGLMKIIELLKNGKDSWKNLIKYAAFAFSGLFVLTILLSQPIADWFTGRIEETRYAQNFSQIYDWMGSMFLNDLWFALGLTAAVFWLAVLYLRKTIGANVMVAAIIILTLVDLWRIDSRGAKYVENPDISGMFKKPAYVEAIENETNQTPFRIFNMKQDNSLGSLRQNSNFHAHFLLEDFYGYSAIKPRAYQDILDVVTNGGPPVNPTLWDMCNVRYVITEQPVGDPGFREVMAREKSYVYENLNAFERVYFVNSVKKQEPFEFLTSIKNRNFNPKETAVLIEETPEVSAPDSTASITITHYDEAKIELDVNASGNNFLVFTNTYVPTGWNAAIDGEETKLYRANHNFMGIVVPQGSHTVTFTYAPTSFFISKYIVLVLSSLVVGAIIVLVILRITKKGKPDEEQEEQEKTDTSADTSSNA